MKMMGSKQIFRNSPKLARGEDGKMRVTNPKSEVESADIAAAGEPVNENQMLQPHERREAVNRHIKDHLDMMSRHELERSSYKGSTGELHGRHLDERRQLHARHDQEMTDMFGRHEMGRKDMMEKGEEE